MRILRVGLVLGLIVGASACRADDAFTGATSVPPTTTSVTDSTPTTEPSAPGTTAPPTTPPPTTAPQTTASPAATPPTTAPPTTPAPATTTAMTPATAPLSLTEVKVYFLREERLVIVHRTVTGPAVLGAALDELLKGPTASERAAGLHSEVPDGTVLRSLNLAEGLVTADLTSEFAVGGGTSSMTARLAQVIFTATQFDNADEVLFWLDGAPVEFFGGEGIVLDEPQARMHVDLALTTGIIIDTPTPGATVSSPFTVTGEGDAYEGDFPMEVRRDGQRIGDIIIVRAGAWGDWADFETTIRLDIPAGPIEVVAWNEFGCTADSEPNCASIVETVIPLTFAG